MWSWRASEGWGAGGKGLGRKVIFKKSYNMEYGRKVPKLSFWKPQCGIWQKLFFWKPPNFLSPHAASILAGTTWSSWRQVPRTTQGWNRYHLIPPLNVICIHLFCVTNIYIHLDCRLSWSWWTECYRAQASGALAKVSPPLLLPKLGRPFWGMSKYLNSPTSK